MFRDLTLQWKHIYTLPRITTIDSKLRCFQYKILYNTLYLNQKLILFRKHNTSLCSFGKLEDETVFQIYVHCSNTKWLWCTVIEYFERNLHIPLLSPQSAIFGFFEANDEEFLILNHLLLLFKYYVYVSRSSRVLSFEALLKSIMKVYKLETTLSQSDERKENYLHKNGKQFCKICKTFRKYEVPFL